MGHMLPPGGINWQLIYPNYSHFTQINNSFFKMSTLCGFIWRGEGVLLIKVRIK
jgi:hypothetical protein